MIKGVTLSNPPGGNDHEIPIDSNPSRVYDLSMTKPPQSFRWAFVRPSGGGIVWIGPYYTADEARSAFQRLYGFWPLDYVDREHYHLTARF